MIIVEGLDNTGKTTLVKELVNRLGIPSMIRVRPKAETEFRIDLLRVLTDGPWIMDRHPIISEMVYGPILRGGMVIEEDNLNALATLIDQSPMFIYCRPPDSVILNFGEREQMDGVIDQAQILLARYDFVMQFIRSRLPDRVIFYDYQSMNDTRKAHLLGQLAVALVGMDTTKKAVYSMYEFLKEIKP